VVHLLTPTSVSDQSWIIMRLYMPLRGDEQIVKARNDGEDGRKRNNGRVSFDIFDFMRPRKWCIF
jgi:hypothetical protein